MTIFVVCAFYNKTENTIQIFILKIILKVCPSIISLNSENLPFIVVVLSFQSLTYSILFIFTSVDVFFFSLQLEGLSFIMFQMFIRSIFNHEASTCYCKSG